MPTGATTTAIALARDLGTDPSSFRSWLRSLVALGFPVVAGHGRYDRWVFTPEGAAALRELYEGTFPPSGIALRFEARERRDVHFDELASFLGGLQEAYLASWSAELRGSVRSIEPTVRRLRMESPFLLELGLPPEIPVAILGLVLRYLAQILRTEVEAERVAVEAFRAETDRIRAGTDAARQQTEEKESAARRRKLRAEAREINARIRPRLEDRTGLLEGVEQVSDREDRIASPDRALQVLDESPIHLERVVVLWVRHSRRPHR